jgi:type IV pilus assembly protein PilB
MRNSLMSAEQQPKKMDLFGQHLVAVGKLSQDQLNQALLMSGDHRDSLVHTIIDNHIMTSHDVAVAVADYYDLPYYDISTLDLESIDEKLMKFKLVKSQHVFPISAENNTLLLAIIDPSHDELQEIDQSNPDLTEYAFNSGYKIKYVVVDDDKLKHIFSNLNLTPQAEVTSIKESMDDLSTELMVDFEGIDLMIEDDEVEHVEDLEHEETPIVHFVNKILLDAINSHSSDIHFEPYEGYSRVRYRQDGILYEVVKPPKQLSASIVARIKVMSNLDISEHRIPQDGRFKLRLGGNRAIDFRVSTCPTMYGEKVVMRILDADSTPLVLDDLGMEDLQKKAYLSAISNAQGMILVTGPTGSGKTVSLYTALGMLNTTEKNISTIEDPVEIYMHGINQVQVNNKAGLNFSSALRSFLRQDPDIIMVGEIRDLETAEIAVKASQTGHLVLSTLHTNNAPVTLARLSNMGVEPFNIASSVILVMAQRLVRKLCEHCKKPVVYDHAMLEQQGVCEAELEGLELFEAGDCVKCVGGYRGRIGIYEVMPISAEMTHIIMNKGTSIDLEKQANKEGIDSLRQSGLKKVQAGLTSLQELNRVIAV